jgi:REP element-mobilizing transposase RayT
MRARKYDYSGTSAYFVTICADGRQPLFGEIHSGIMGMNEVGCIVVKEWLRTEELRRNVSLDEFIVMPNHFHGILVITVSVQEAVPSATSTTGDPPSRPYGLEAGSLGAIIGQFKSAVSKRAGRAVWQRNYYDHIIRDDRDLDRIREYIATNPVRWSVDRENPRHTGEDEFDRWLSSFKHAPVLASGNFTRATRRVAPTNGQTS